MRYALSISLSAIYSYFWTSLTVENPGIAMFNRFFFLVLLSIFSSIVTVAESLAPNSKISLFAKGHWLKVETTSSGILKLDYSWLKKNGFNNPEKVKIFGSRNEAMSPASLPFEDNRPLQIPTFTIRTADGNDAILFYAQGDVKWIFSASSKAFRRVRNQASVGKTYFFLTDDSGIDRQLQSNKPAEGTPDIQISDGDESILWEEENINLLESGNKWFSTLLKGGNVLNKSFQFQDRSVNGEVNIAVYAAGRSTSSSGMDVLLNGNTLGSIPFRSVSQATDADFVSEDSLVVNRVVAGQSLTFSLKYNGSASDQCWLDYATIQFRKNLHYRGNPLFIRNGKQAESDKLAEYQVTGVIPGLQLWEITNPSSPLLSTYKMNNGVLTFLSKCDSLRSFILFDPQNSFPTITKTEEVLNVDLNFLEAPQYLILTPLIFLEQAERLAQYHRNTDHLTVAVATVESIFNEYSGGYRDVCALRNLIKYLFDKKSGTGVSTLKYLLLFGKGTCDPVHDPGENNPNWIPSLQSENSINPVNSYVSDDFFGLLNFGSGDQLGRIDIGIGRIPASNIAEAKTAVEKIIHYHDASTLGDWRNNITFMGDDEDGNLHVDDSEKLAFLVNKLNPEYRISKIYFDAFQQVQTPEERYPDVTEAIRRSVQEGDLIVNYIGHASEDGLAHERVLTIKDIDAWTNKTRLPLFVTATCEFSRWDMTVKRSAGEHLFFNPSGGAIALFSATRLVYSASNFEINKSFFSHLFDKDQMGDPLRLGDLIRQVKNENGGTINTSKFCLLGDPAMHLNYPEYRCVNTAINKLPVSQFGGTLSQLTSVTISGEITDNAGKKMEFFNGILTAEVFDQPTSKMTLGNGGLPIFYYQVQNTILFNGTVSVKNGSFTYSFVVPLDVNFNSEAGLIRYYVSNGTTDGNGSFANLHFNGKDSPISSDKIGPDIQIFLENEKFREGGNVSSRPLLIAYLNDESGINTSGFGIGHDITLELDGQTANYLILNDYYKTDVATWKSGFIKYPISELSKGTHSLIFRAWDTANNSSSTEVHFAVREELMIDELYNYPNPFSEQTRFVISHNRYDEQLSVNFEVMDQVGRIIYTNKQELASAGYEISDLSWTPLLQNPYLTDGLYIYRITLTGKDGSHHTKSGRMIWKKQ